MLGTFEKLPYLLGVDIRSKVHFCLAYDMYKHGIAIKTSVYLILCQVPHQTNMGIRLVLPHAILGSIYYSISITWVGRGAEGEAFQVEQGAQFWASSHL
jgi:hypothetical protein